MKDRIIQLFKQFVSFGIVGGINTILGLVIYWVMVGAGIHYLIANTVGFIITVAISYVLNNLFTFKKDGVPAEWSLKQLLKVYASYFLTGMILSGVLLWFWNDFIGINKNISPILNLFITIPTNFILNKKWVYKRRK